MFRFCYVLLWLSIDPFTHSSQYGFNDIYGNRWQSRGRFIIYEAAI